MGPAPVERSAPELEREGPPPWLAGPDQATRRPPLPESPAPQSQSGPSPTAPGPQPRRDEPHATDGPPPWLVRSSTEEQPSAEQPGRRGPELPPSPGELAARTDQATPAETGPIDSGAVASRSGGGRPTTPGDSAPTPPDGTAQRDRNAPVGDAERPGTPTTPERGAASQHPHSAPTGDRGAERPGMPTAPEHGTAPQGVRNGDRATQRPDIPAAPERGSASQGLPNAPTGSERPGAPTPEAPQHRGRPETGPGTTAPAPSGPMAPQRGQLPPDGTRPPSTTGPLGTGAPQPDRTPGPASTPQAPAAEYQGPNGTTGPQLPVSQPAAERQDANRQAPGWVASSGAGTGSGRPNTSGRHRMAAEFEGTAPDGPPRNDLGQPTADPATPTEQWRNPGDAGQAPGAQWRGPAGPTNESVRSPLPFAGGQAPAGETGGYTPPFMGGQAPGSEQPGPQIPGEQQRNAQAPTGRPAQGETGSYTPPFIGGQAPGSDGPQAANRQHLPGPAPTGETGGYSAPFMGGQAPSGDEPGAPGSQQVGQAPGTQQAGGYAGPTAGQGPQAGHWGRPTPQPQHPGQPLQQPGVQYQQGPSPSLDNVPVRRAQKSPGSGWRKAVHHVSGGAINPGLSAEERRLQELVARIRQPVRGDYRIATLSLKGGVGKTTTTMGIGSIFASIRGDRVIAVDANPDFGTLSQRVPLQTRSTVRDLLLDPSIQRYSDVRRHTSQATSRLEVLASERDPAASEAFSEDEYRAVARILQRFYNIILTDCGTGLMHSAMAGVLELAHSLVLISSPAIDGARSAAATLDWLSLHGHDHLVRNAVVVINSPRAGSPNVGILQLREYFLSRCRAVHIIPFDMHMSEGAEIDLHRLHKQTKRAYVELAATIADDFATDHRRYHP
ncbi:AAA family ATPase [Nocardia sp. NPDC049149]|uniref:nucleotide-binding protein n=1 Tax=Nocardia sp. NPDC049149 TaxID=3364315 RepID=UPI00372227FA